MTNNPKFEGKIEDSDFSFTLKSEFCGDWVDIFVSFDDKKHIKEMKYKSIGCALALTYLEKICEIAKGKNVEEFKIEANKIVSDSFEIPYTKKHCAKLIKDIIEKF